LCHALFVVHPIPGNLCRGAGACLFPSTLVRLLHEDSVTYCCDMGRLPV
jgi:hypothetical protein